MADTSAITQEGWRTGRNGAVVTAIAITEKTAASGMFHLIVLQMFDNAAFYARKFEGGLITCQRELVRGTYHSDGASQWRLLRQSLTTFSRFVMPLVAPEFSSCLCWLVTSMLMAAMTMIIPQKGLTRGSAPFSSPPP